MSRSTEGHQVPRRRDLPFVDVGGELVVANPATGAVTHLERLEALIWTLLDGSSTFDELVEDVAAAFEVQPSRVERDLVEYLRSLREHGLHDDTTPA